MVIYKTVNRTLTYELIDVHCKFKHHTSQLLSYELYEDITVAILARLYDNNLLNLKDCIHIKRLY
jgi:hypothetical protein